MLNATDFNRFRALSLTSFILISVYVFGPFNFESDGARHNDMTIDFVVELRAQLLGLPVVFILKIFGLGSLLHSLAWLARAPRPACLLRATTIHLSDSLCCVLGSSSCARYLLSLGTELLHFINQGLRRFSTRRCCYSVLVVCLLRSNWEISLLAIELLLDLSISVEVTSRSSACTD